MGRGASAGGRPAGCAKAADMGAELEHPAARCGGEDDAGCAASRERRRGLHVRSRSDALHGGPLGADDGGFASAASQRAPCRGVHPAAGFQLAAPRTCGQTVYRGGPDGSGRPARGALDRQRHLIGLCAGKLAGRLAGNDGKACAGGVGLWFFRCTTRRTGKRGRIRPA